MAPPVGAGDAAPRLRGPGPALERAARPSSSCATTTGVYPQVEEHGIGKQKQIQESNWRSSTSRRPPTTSRPPAAMIREFRKPLVLTRSRCCAIGSSSRCRRPRAGHQVPAVPRGHRDRRREKVRLVMCTGKVYYDLAEPRRGIDDVAIARCEQIAPFPSIRQADAENTRTPSSSGARRSRRTRARGSTSAADHPAAKEAAARASRRRSPAAAVRVDVDGLGEDAREGADGLHRPGARERLAGYRQCTSQVRGCAHRARRSAGLRPRGASGWRLAAPVEGERGAGEAGCQGSGRMRHGVHREFVTSFSQSLKLVANVGAVAAQAALRA